MKKIFVALLCAVSLCVLAQDDGSTNTPPPSLHFTSQTNVTTRLSPITLTADQIDALIGSLSAAGISSDVPVSSTNLQSIIVNKLPNGSFVVRVTIR